MNFSYNVNVIKIGRHHVTKVLVVDDEQSIVTLLKYNLETAGYIVEVAYDGEGTTKVEDEQPELIVLDVMLPKKMVLRCVNQFDLIKFSTYFNVNC